MADPVAAVAGQTVALDPGLFAGATGGREPSNTLDKEAFLKLLVAQLKFQDPMNPTSNEEFVSTTAQFSTIEKLEELTAQGAVAAQVSSLATASALIGRQVTVMDEGGALLTATVQRGQLVGGVLSLETTLGPIGLDRIVSIGPPAPTTATPTTATPTTATPTTTTTETTTP